MGRWILIMTIPLMLAGCISSSNPPPPRTNTVIVPPAQTVCSDGTYPPCNY